MPRRIFVELFVGLALLVAGIGIGRFATPARVVKDRWDHDVVRKEAVFVAAATAQSNTMLDEHMSGAFNGTRTTITNGLQTTVVEQGQIVWGDHVQSASSSKLSLDVKTTTTSVSDHTEQTHTVVENQARLNLGLGLGGELQFNPWGAGVVVLAEGSYRIAGPFGLGAWLAVSAPPTWPPTGVNFVGGGLLLTFSL